MLNYELIPADPDKGYNFPYILVFPDSPSSTVKVLVEGNNSVIYEEDGQDSFEQQQKYALNFAKHLCEDRDSSVFDAGYMYQQLNQPLIIPIIERCDKQHKGEYYPQMLGRNVILDKHSKFAGLPRQIVAMVDEVKNKYENKGYNVAKKGGLIGISTSGVFAGRMLFAEPENFDFCLSVCSNAVQPLPIPAINGVDLPYPLGTYDYEEIFGKPFNLEGYKNARQLFIVGKDEPNTKYNIVTNPRLHDPEIQDKYLSVYGNVTLQERQEQISNIMEILGIDNTRCVIANGGHSYTGKGNLIMNFIQQSLDNTSTDQEVLVLGHK